MYHGITFEIGSKRYTTWDNWRLIPSSRPVIAQPTPVFKYVEIPGRDGALDTTDYLIGRPTYSDRKGQLEFYVMNDGVKWTTRRDSIAAVLNGRKMKVILDDDIQHCYHGRVFFKDWKSDASSNYSRVTIEYQLSPYRYTLTGQEVGL